MKQSLFDQGPGPACPDPFNMAGYVLARADAQPDKTALLIVSHGSVERWSYGRLKAAILGTATGLRRSGLKPGDRLLMRLGNTVDFPITYLAAIAAGIIPVPTSGQLGLAEINKISAQMNPSAIVASPDVPLPDNTVCPVIDTATLRTMRELPEMTPIPGDPNRPAYIVFTSGTSGEPRGVVHAHRAVWARRMMWDGWYGLRQTDRLLHAGAFNWTYTMGTGLMDPWAIGATAIIPGGDVALHNLPQIMADHRASIFAAAPGVYQKLLKSDIPPLPRLRHGLSAGEKLAPEIRDDWHQKTGTNVYEAFGMSECSTFISSAPDHPAPPDSIGFAQTGRRIAILAPDAIARIGEPGVIGVANTDPGLMLGYLGNSAQTAARFRDGWFLTGDIGEMDKNGAVRYLGRNDDMMNAGGFRTSPIEVEAEMRSHPGIIECAASETDIRAGVSVIALFYTAEKPVPDTELAAHAKARLARYKQPRMFIHLSDLPRGGNGKIQRRALRRNQGQNRGQNQDQN